MHRYRGRFAASADHIHCSVLLQSGDHFQDIFVVPMRGIHDDEVSCGFNQSKCALVGLFTHTYSRTDDQTPSGVLGGQRVLIRLFKVFDGNQSTKSP